MATHRFDAAIDVEATFGCGQLYDWWRDREWYVTELDGGAIRVRQDGDGAAVETGDVDRSTVRRFLGLEAELDAILDAIAVDGPTRRAVAAHQGLRLLNIPPWRCLVGFIGSQRATVGRTTAMVRRLCERHGAAVGDAGAHRMPPPERIADLGEAALENCGFGYRAAYLADTAQMVADGAVGLEGLAACGYEEAKRQLTELPGVGDKVADCVLLFGCAFRDVVALDTRIRSIVEDHYPELLGTTYRETAERFRDRFSPHTGYAQTYLYHAASPR